MTRVQGVAARLAFAVSLLLPVGQVMVFVTSAIQSYRDGMIKAVSTAVHCCRSRFALLFHFLG